MSAHITATCHSDDYEIEVTFNALPWFEQATDEKIVKLAEEEFGGDYTADSVAEFVAASNQMVQDLFDYLALVNNHRGEKDPVGFECHVNEEMALHWIKEHRQHLMVKIESDEEGE